MTDERLSTAQRILTGTLMLGITQMGTLLLTFLGQRIVLSTLSKEENGFLFSERRFVDLFVLLLVDFGLNGVVMRRVVQDPTRAGITLSSSIALRFALWLPATAWCIGYAAFSSYSIADVAIWCCFLMLSSRAGLVRHAMEIPRRARMKFGLVSSLIVFDALLFLILIHLWRYDLTASVVIRAYALSAIPGFVFLFLLDRGATMRFSNVKVKEMKTLLIEALPVFGSIALVNLHDKIDAMLLGWFSTASEVGVFGAVYVSLSPLSGVIPVAISMALIPAVARYAADNWDECRRFTLTGARFLMVIAVFVCTVASTLTPFVIALVSKGKYADNTLQFFSFFWVPVPIFFVVFAQEVNIALGKQRTNLPIALTLALSTIVVGLILIPQFDSMGAIVTKFVAVILGSLVAVKLLYTILDTKVDIGFVLKIIFASILGIAASWYLPQFMNMWVATLCSSLSVLLFFVATGLLRRSDIDLFRRIIQARHA